MLSTAYFKYLSVFSPHHCSIALSQGHDTAGNKDGGIFLEDRNPAVCQQEAFDERENSPRLALIKEKDSSFICNEMSLETDACEPVTSVQSALAPRAHHCF